MLRTTAARMSSRSIFTKPNAPVYVSSLRSLSDQRELRHIYASAARTNPPPSLFANSNSSVYVSSLRKFSDQKKWSGQRRFSQTAADKEFERKREEFAVTMATISSILLVAGFAVCIAKLGIIERDCTREFHLKHESSEFDPVDTTVQSINGALVSLRVLPSVSTKGEIYIRSNVEVKLPNREHSSVGNTSQAIYEGLKLRGIDVECSEAGVRRGLTTFALKQLHDGLGKHLSASCECGHFVAPSNVSSYPVNAAPDLCEDTEVEMTVMPPRMLNLSRISICCIARISLPNADDSTPREISDGLKDHGIDVDCSYKQISRGLATFALRQMLDKLGKHLNTECECDFFSNAAAQSIQDGFGKRHRTTCTCGYFSHWMASVDS